MFMRVVVTLGLSVLNAGFRDLYCLRSMKTENKSPYLSKLLKQKNKNCKFVEY